MNLFPLKISILIVGLSLFGCENGPTTCDLDPPPPPLRDTIISPAEMKLIRRSSTYGPTTLDSFLQPADTLITHVDIYHPGRKFTYEAVVFGPNSDSVISLENIIVTMQGDFMNGSQMRAEYLYSSAQDTLGLAVAEKYNPGISPRDRWTVSVGEGIIERVNNVWWHPFRSNQYLMTEICPFPSIDLPPKVGSASRSILSIGNGWGDWENIEVDNTYEVLAQTEVKLNGCTLPVWPVYAEGISSLGTNTVTFYFNEQHGFVKMDYQLYGGERILFTLVDVEN